MSLGLFNPRPQLQAVPIGELGTCWVVENALNDPQGMREWAIRHRHHFQTAPTNAYPGIELVLPTEVTRQLGEFFDTHLRRRFDARRTLDVHARLAMVTLGEEQLQARQWIPHRDSAWVDPAHCIAASVLYLFEDESLGGTSFHAPRKPMSEIERMVHEASTLGNVEFSAKHPFPPRYYQGPDAYFQVLARMPPKFNRMVFYDGRIFHCGDIPAHAPRDALDSGRLTLNGFFTCSRRAM